VDALPIAENVEALGSARAQDIEAHGPAREQKLAHIDDPVALLEGLFAYAPVGFEVFDSEGYLQVHNKAVTELFGTAPPDGYNIFKDNLAQAAGYTEVIKRAFAGETSKLPAIWYDPSRVEHVHADAPTRLVAVEATMFPLRDRAGLVRHVGMCLKDVTAEMRLREGLIEQAEAHAEYQRLTLQNQQTEAESRLKSEFLANMSHELRTPLNAVLGFAELIADNVVPMGSPQYTEFLGHILSSGRHLLRLINDVLDLTKVEAGRMDFRPENVDPAQLVHDVCNILRATAQTRDVEIVPFCDASVSEAFLDPVRFKQMLFNYLSNALKFSHEGGRVEVRLSPAGENHLRIEVQDAGIGIAPEQQERLFVEFHQLEPGHAKLHRGVGLGLALTKRLVEAQDGHVGVDSQLGRGSTFYAVLPRRVPARLSSSPPRSTPEPGKSNTGAPRVLVVDDDFASLRLMETALSQLGYDPIGTIDAEHGLLLAEKLKPECIVLDLMLRCTDGFSLLERLREQPSQKKIPVIVWTMKDLTADERDACAQRGGSAHQGRRRGHLAADPARERFAKASELTYITRHERKTTPRRPVRCRPQGPRVRSRSVRGERRRRAEQEPRAGYRGRPRTQRRPRSPGPADSALGSMRAGARRAYGQHAAAHSQSRVGRGAGSRGRSPA
jgi:signal transduction histidine kinase